MTGIACVMLGSASRNFDGVYSGVAGTDGNLIGYGNGTAGSITPTVFAPSGNIITVLGWNSALSQVVFGTSGGANSGWTSLIVNGNTYLRSAATYAAGASWRWAEAAPQFTDGAPFSVQIT